MKKIFIIVFMIFIFLTTSCTKQEVKEVKKYYNTTTVQTGIVDEGENYVGYAHGITEVTLSTQSNGKVTFLKSKLGDKVKSGDLLASLDSLDAKVGYNTASNIIGSLDTLKDFTGLSYDEQIKVIEKKIEEIKVSDKVTDKNASNLQNLKSTELISGELNIKQSQTQVDIVKNELEQTINVFEGKKQDLYKSGKNVVTNSIILNTNIINFSDDILGVTEKNKDKNNSFQDYLGAKNTDIFNQTKEKFIETNNLFLDYKSYYESTFENKDPNNQEIITGLEKGLAVAEKSKEMLNLLYKTISNSIESTYLTSDTLKSYSDKILSFGNQLESSILTVNGSFIFGLRGTTESLDSLVRDYNMQKVLLQKKIDIAQDNLQTVKQSLDKIQANSVISTDSELSKKLIYEKQIEGLLAQIESIKSDKNAKLKDLDSNIIKIKGDQSIAGVQIQNGKIYSPIDGIILEKFSEVGQITSAGNSIYIVGDDSKIKINIDILADNLDKFTIGKSINIEFEGLEKKVTGIITNIPPISNFETKKTTIELIVDNKDKK